MASNSDLQFWERRAYELATKLQRQLDQGQLPDPDLETAWQNVSGLSWELRRELGNTPALA